MTDTLLPLVGYTPFVSPLPVWDYWYTLLIPLAAGVAVVYKTIRCRKLRDVPWQSALVTLWIIGGMIGAALVLWAIVRLKTH